MSNRKLVGQIIDDINADLDETSPDLKKIFFSQANITDVLLPFPADGKGLPSKFRGSAECARFCERQSEYLDKEDDIDAAIQGDNLRHLHLDDGIIDRRLLHKELGGTKHSTVYVVRTKTRGQPKEVAVKMVPRPHLKPQAWPSIDHVGDGKRDKYPDPHQDIFEREVFTLTTLRTKPLEKGDWHLGRIRDDHIISIMSSFTDPSHFGLFLSPLGLCDLESLLRQYEDDMGSSEINLCGMGVAQDKVQKWLFGCFGCLAATVLFLHQSELRHRDLKPKNIIIYESGFTNQPHETVDKWKVCVIDFATVKKFTPGSRADTEGQPQIFTPDYLSPEKATNQPRTEKEDMYHLGRIFLEILIPLTGRKLGELKAKLLEEPRDPLDQYLQVDKKFLKWTEFEDWLRNSVTSTAGLNAALNWTIKLLSFDPSKRPDSEALVKEIKGPYIACETLRTKGCCKDFFLSAVQTNGMEWGKPLLNFPANHVKYWHSSPRNGSTMALPSESRLPKGKPNRSYDDTVTISLVEDSLLERRLILAGDKKSSDSSEDSTRNFRLWLPITGISISIGQSQNHRDYVSMNITWSDFKQEMKKSMGDGGNEYWRGTRPERPNESISLDIEKKATQYNADVLVQYLTNLSIEESEPEPEHFTFSGYRSQPNSNSISLGTIDSLRLSNALSKNLDRSEPKYARSLSHHITRQSGALTTSTVTTYFVQERKRLQQLDIQLLWKEKSPYLRIDGLQTVSYDGSKRMIGSPLGPEDQVQNVVFPDHGLEVDLSKTGITREIGLIHGAGIDQNPWAKDLCGFMRELTGYELQMLCNVEKVEVGPPKSGFFRKRQQKRGAALLLLWRSPTDTPDSNTTYWITLRFVESSHGKKQWLHGKRVGDVLKTDRTKEQSNELELFNRKDDDKFHVGLLMHSDSDSTCHLKIKFANTAGTSHPPPYM